MPSRNIDVAEEIERTCQLFPHFPDANAGRFVRGVVDELVRHSMNVAIQQMKDPAKFTEQTADQKCAGFCSYCGQPCEVGEWEVEDTSFGHEFGTEVQYSATPLSSCCEEEIMDDAALTISSTLEYEPGDDEPTDFGD